MQFTKKQKVAAALGAGAVAVAGSGVAFAYFTDTGSGSASGAVGTSSHWTVNPVTVDTTTALLPGYGSQNISYLVTNASDGHQAINDIKVGLQQDASGNVMQLVTPSGGGTAVATAVPGCLASWFTIDGQAQYGVTSASGVTPVTHGATPTDYPKSPVVDLAGGGHYAVVPSGGDAVSPVLALTNSTTVAQDACQGVKPIVQVFVS